MISKIDCSAFNNKDGVIKVYINVDINAVKITTARKAK